MNPLPFNDTSDLPPVTGGAAPTLSEPDIQPPRQPRLIANSPGHTGRPDNDWSLYSEAREYGPPEVKELLAIIRDKLTSAANSRFAACWGGYDEWYGYGATASIIAHSDDPQRRDFIYCGYQGHYNWRFHCRNPHLCPSCSYHRYGSPSVEEYGHAIGAGLEAYHLVVSLSNNPDETTRLIVRDWDGSDGGSFASHNPEPRMDPADYGIPLETADDLAMARLIWEFAIEVVHYYTGKRPYQCFAGVVGGPELGIQLLPLRGLPHVHFVVWSRDLTSDNMRQLRGRMRDSLACRPFQRMRRKRGIKPLYPTVALYRIQSTEGLQRALNYILKPIALSTAYVRGGNRCGWEFDAVNKLNCETNLLLENLRLVFHDVPKVFRFGVCRAGKGKSDYIGNVPESRIRRNAKAKKRRLEKVREKAEFLAAMGVTASKTKRSKNTLPSVKKRKATPLDRADEFIEYCIYRKFGPCFPPTPRIGLWLVEHGVPPSSEPTAPNPHWSTDPGVATGPNNQPRTAPASDRESERPAASSSPTQTKSPETPPATVGSDKPGRLVGGTAGERLHGNDSGQLSEA